MKESDSTSLRSAEYDLPYVFDKKEKFKMVLGKSKKETQDSLTKTSEQEVGVKVDAAAAAAILQAATRGIKNPNLSIISGSSKNGNSQGHSSEGAQTSSFHSVPPSGPSMASQKSDSRMGHSVSIPKVKEIAKSAAAEAAGEADSSEAHLSKELKLKAERLRRAKMFVSLLKSGAAPAKRDSLGGSVEPQESAVSGSATEANVATKEREGSAALAEVTAVEREGSTAPLNGINVSNENEKSEIQHTAEEHERRSRRKYRSRSGIYEDEDEEEEGQEEEHQLSRKKRHSSRKDEDEESEEIRDDKRSRKKRRSRKKHHKRHSSPEDDDEQRDAERHHKHGRKKHSSHRSSRENEKDDYEGDYKHSKKKHRSHRTSHRSRDRHEHRTKDSSDHESDRSYRTSRRSKDRHKRKTKHSSDDEPERKHKHASSSDDDEQRYDRADKNKKGTKEREELEEGEILTKVSDQSRASLGGSVSREASVDVSSSQQRAPSQPSESTEVSDDLRAKIRAMLMATRT